jgi:hypothetical protein
LIPLRDFGSSESEIHCVGRRCREKDQASSAHCRPLGVAPPKSILVATEIDDDLAERAACHTAERIHGASVSCRGGGMLMRTGRPIAPLSLTVEERETLGRWARRPKSAQALAQRSRVVLECAAGQPNTVVARKLGLTHQTVGKCASALWRGGWTGCWTNRVPGHRARSVMRKLSEWFG